MFEILGVVGIALSLAAYVPQVVHLGREHCSAGVSTRAWAMWLVSCMFVGALALASARPCVRPTSGKHPRLCRLDPISGT